MPHQNLTDHFWTSSGSSSYPKALLFPCDPFASVLHLTLEPDSKLVSDLVVFSADLILAIKPLEPADRKMAAGHVLEVLDERIVHRGAPPRAPTTGSACAATFWVTTNPKRAATWVTNMRRIGAPSLTGYGHERFCQQVSQRTLPPWPDLSSWRRAKQRNSSM